MRFRKPMSTLFINRNCPMTTTTMKQTLLLSISVTHLVIHCVALNLFLLRMKLASENILPSGLLLQRLNHYQSAYASSLHFKDGLFLRECNIAVLSVLTALLLNRSHSPTLFLSPFYLMPLFPHLY